MLTPLLTHNVKIDHGFHHGQTGALLCPTNLDWSDIKYVMSPITIHAPTVTVWNQRKAQVWRAGDNRRWMATLSLSRLHLQLWWPWKGLFYSLLLVKVCLCLPLLVPSLAYIYFTQLCWKRIKGNAFGKHLHTWNGLHFTTINCIHCNPSILS